MFGENSSTNLWKEQNLLSILSWIDLFTKHETSRGKTSRGLSAQTLSKTYFFVNLLSRYKGKLTCSTRRMSRFSGTGICLLAKSRKRVDFPFPLGPTNPYLLPAVILRCVFSNKSFPFALIVRLCTCENSKLEGRSDSQCTVKFTVLWKPCTNWFWR